MPDGSEVKSFTLENDRGVRATLLEYGAILASLEAPDRNGKLADITLGYDSLDGWLSNTSYFGAVVGRHANRIAAGRFTLDGKSYTLATNNAPGGMPCHLHGGKVGFDKRHWRGEIVERPDGQAVAFTYVSAAGEEGYPGTLTTVVTYCLTPRNELEVEVHATTDAPTIVNLAHHAYWNLSGDATRPITDHELMLAADEMLPVDAGLIPTGRTAPVRGTPFDFTTPRRIGDRIDAADEQVKLGNGYDHCWVLRDGDRERLPAAVAYEPESGRVLEVFTNQPGLQFYSGNFLDGSARGKGGVPYRFRTGFCLETQKFPDSPNQPSFPSTVLRPGDVYRHTLTWRFSTR
jgi:aldose 1-epimerase